MLKAVTFKQVMLCKWEQFRFKMLILCFWKNDRQVFFVEFPLKPILLGERYNNQYLLSACNHDTIVVVSSAFNICFINLHYPDVRGLGYNILYQIQLKHSWNLWCLRGLINCLTVSPKCTKSLDTGLRVMKSD